MKPFTNIVVKLPLRSTKVACKTEAMLKLAYFFAD
jgi:hypothetical protein